MNRLDELVSIRNSNHFSLQKREYLCMYILYTHITWGVSICVWCMYMCMVCVCVCCDSCVNMCLCGDKLVVVQ